MCEEPAERRPSFIQHINMASFQLNCPVSGCSWQSQSLPAALADALNTALSLHARTEHPVQHAQASAPSLKLKSPSISAGCSPDQWTSFTRQWSMYKTGMSISTAVLATALFHCCDEELMTDLMRDLQQDVSAMSEDDLLAAIKRLAVREESTLVHRIRISKMTQAPGTPIRTFLAALKGQAALCKYTANCKMSGCTHVFDYSTEIIKDNLVRGIADPEILNDILGDSKTDRTLEETVDFIAQKEQGKATRAAVGENASAMSQVRTNRNRHTPTADTTELGKCWACGEARHAKVNDRNTRARLCEAWSTTCSKCSAKGHYTNCCNKCTACGAWGHRDKNFRTCPQNPRRKGGDKGKAGEALKTEDDEAGATYDQLCAVETDPINRTHRPPVEHRVHESGKWVARPSKPHPVITVRLTPLPDDHKALGYPLRSSNPTPIDIPIIADTGCQSSIIPLRSALAMGVAKSDIFPVTLSMRGAIQEDLGVEGGILAEAVTTDAAGMLRKTKQLVYVSNKIGKAFLCREALVSLGVIPPDFPSVPVAWPTDMVASVEDHPPPACSCPKRSTPPPIPTALPPGLSATADDVPALRQWLLDHYAASTFNKCEHQPLPMMNCEPLELHVNPDAKPVAVHKPGLVPIHWQEQVYKDLERDVRIGVLEKVSPNTPVTWCSRMVVTAKSDGTPRRTVDLQPQNRQSVRQTHHVQSPFHLAVRVPQHTKKTVTDAWNGYHSVPIREEDRHITTFITPWGRYRYKVAPQGFLASGDAYNQRFDAIIANFKNKVKCVDDTCMWADSIEGSFFQACEWLDLCGRNGITLNPRKFQFAQDTVDFAGLSITPTNVKPSAKFLDSIEKFPQPSDITGARAWFGLVNQGAYAFSMAKRMQPFRHLLKPKAQFKWTPELDSVFRESKEVITQEMKDGVRLFQPSRPTCLVTDWSTTGIGFCLLQKYCSCTTRTPICCEGGWKLCLVGSRFTHGPETRYAPVEGEALAVVYALHQTRYYIQGCADLTVATDHKPLVGILNERSLTDIDNRRLLNLKEKAMPYKFRIIHVSGKRNAGADAASRYPLPGPHVSDLDTSGDETIDLAEDGAILASMSASLQSVSNVTTWDMVREATASDEQLITLQHVIEDGFPEDCRQLAPELRPYHRISGSLCIVDGVVLSGSRIVIPRALRQGILEALHAAHQGVSAMFARAADSVYWPNMSVDIQRIRDECSHCHRIAKSNPMQPPTDITPPVYPFQQICCDYFSFNNHDYVVVVDRYSNWPMVFRSENGADGLVKRLREVFVTFGIPEELTSDGGPQFTSGKTQCFLKSWGVHHRLTSVANPHANCRAEIGVKTVKRMLMDNTSPNGSIDVDRFQRAMLVYRNAIDPETRASPAMIVFGRPIRDPIPIPMGRYCPHPTWVETLAHREQALAKRHSKEREKWKEHTKALPPLQVGDHVYLQNLTGNHPLRWERTGKVVEVRQFHQYVIRVDGSGRTTLRNRQHLRKFTPFNDDSRDRIIESFIPPAVAQWPTYQPPSSGSFPPQEHEDTGRPCEPQVFPPETSEVTRPAASPAASPLSSTPAPSPQQDTPKPPEEAPAMKPPRLLARLQPHNEPGASELAPLRRPRNRRSEQ